MTAEQNESKNRTVHYRKCEIVADLFTQLHGKTLENLLDEAFDKLDGSSGINRPYNGNSDIIEGIFCSVYEISQIRSMQMWSNFFNTGR